MLTETGIITTDRLTNSANGNPRYKVTLELEHKGIAYYVTGKTKSDSMFVYGMPRSGKAQCSWHVTPSGRVVFDNIQHC